MDKKNPNTIGNMRKWTDNSELERMAMLQQTREKFGININAIEKDWWVSVILRALFSCECREHLSFKGGTSLSKGWNLIERFSEDIDLSISHEYFGVSQTSKNEKEKLRKTARKYISETLAKELDLKLREMGIDGYSIKPITTVQKASGEITKIDSDKDPSVIMVEYNSIVSDSIIYIPTTVNIEISCLSMNEPTENRLLSSLMEQKFPGEDDLTKTSIRTVVPTRTFLEKAFLLCEEFQKNNPRHIRMSRHLYDLEKIMDTEFGTKALQDPALYNEIIKHRETYYSLNYVDYSKLKPESISFVPPQNVISNWETDYQEMQRHFIYGRSLGFNELINRIEELQKRFREIPK